jgi:hypothetical protein
MRFARGLGFVVVVGGIRVGFSGSESHCPVGRRRSQRAAMSGMPDVRQKTD